VKSTGHSLLLAFCFVVLALGAAFQIHILWRRDDFGKQPSDVDFLAKRLPLQLGLFVAHDEPVAVTAEMKQAIGALLNFNCAIYRVYQLPTARVSIYAAWWERGRMPPRMVALHVPDVCWPANGWTRDLAAEKQLSALSRQFEETGFTPGEARVFEMNEKPEYVVFWHKVGDEMLNYRTGYAPPWWAWLDEIWRGGLNLRKEQLFVRISSDQPLQDIWRRPELEPLRTALLQLGLGAKPAGSVPGNLK
jgi:hypothetical protein